MDGEMVLLAMLPEENHVMLVQTPCHRTIADLEDFIVEEYSRVFPYQPALSRDLRIQKCVSPDLVVDHRSYTTSCHQMSHSFVDLAKNVQVGNVFQNMEQIYIALNKKSTKQKPQELNAVVAHSMQAENRAEVKHKQRALKKVTTVARTVEPTTGFESKQKKQVSKKVRTVGLNVQTKNDTEIIETVEKSMQDGKKKQVSKTPSIEKIRQDKKQGTSEIVMKSGTKEIHDATNESNDAKEMTVAETYEKVDVKEKLKMAAKEKTHDAKKTANKENTDNSKNVVAEMEKDTLNTAPKKTVAKKSENVLLKKMLAAKHNGSQSVAALVVNSLQNTESEEPKVPLKSERKRKANDESVLSAEEISASEALEPLIKKKKTVKKSDAKMSKPVEDEVVVAKVEKPAKRTVAQDKTQKTTKKKATTAAKSQLKTDDNSSISSELTPANKDLKKASDTSSGHEEPIIKRAKTEVLPKAPAVKKAAKSVKMATKSATPETGISASPSSESSISSATQEDELAFGEETKVVETSATKTARKEKMDEKPKEVYDQKSNFQKIMADTLRRIADEQNANDAKSTTTVTSEKGSMQTSKSTQSKASEYSSDSDQAPVIVKVAKRSQKNATPAEDNSSSSSEEEEVDYSQRLLADLTKNDGDEEVVSTAYKKGKSSKQIDWRDNSTVQSSQNMEHSQDMPSSKLAQESQESNSVLLPPLSRNRFSLDSVPVAKLKKSSKNPFLSPKKAKVQGGLFTKQQIHVCTASV
ncbi:unnamed protein product [Peronospora belbahrii]|uniref:Nucleolar protein Dnt1-like N-terminal domain-containing protein n=1 Tax=Peronospora belbahrii TaxID=622444 RepID=A0AAU9KZU6_9STRA|nr:unnamed protein product [Peronospora belbahrii]